MDVTRQTDNFVIRNATKMAIGALTVLVSVVLLLFWEQQQSAERSSQWVEHTYEVRGHIRLLASSLRDAEIGQRDFLATGIESYLAPYYGATTDFPSAAAGAISTAQRRSIGQELRVLRDMTADNPAQQSNLDELETAVQTLLDYLKATIAARRSQDPKAIETVFDPRANKEITDQIRSLIRIMDAEETHLVALRAEADQNSAQQTYWMTIAAIGLFYLGLASAIWLYQANRARSQSALMLYTKELERREEELNTQQEELKTSNEEILASNEELEESSRLLEEQNAQIQQQSAELAESKRLADAKAVELERASKYKSEFLANMSHELRTPLNSLLILARLLAANEQGNLTPEQVEEANVIHNGGLELLELINDILDLSKVEAGKLRVTAEDVALESIVSRMRQQFAPIAREANLAFLVKVAEGLPPIMHTDAQRLEQTLKNLLANAFKFTQAGSVTLEVGRPGADIEQQRGSLDYANAVAFSVIDTGIGIEPSKFRDIFEAFQQEDGSIDRHYGGTGLGLTIARKFAHMLGGEIHVRSAKGEGSTFTLVLPARLEQPAPDQLELQHVRLPEARRGGAELKVMPKTQLSEFVPDDRAVIGDKDKVVLIIEDDPDFARTLIKVARKRGYKCLAAGDGKTGLVLAIEAPVAAIILDLKLPDIDGLQVLDQLKHDLGTRHIPVHIISGLDDIEKAVPLRKGAMGYLTKPVRIEALDTVFNSIETMLQASVKRVLIVEDDADTQLAIQNLLKQKDIDIAVAGTGAHALELAEGTRFDCIILDLQLPDMTGFAWLEAIEARGGAAVAPVIVYTARELSEDENRRLSQYTGSIVIKGARSPERLLDEVTLFLHSVESTLRSDQQEMIRMQHDPDNVLRGRTLLLVDDDLRNTFALSKLLKQHGLNIIIADNGQMALDKLASEKSIELVIMDIMMPVMDGYQAMHHIRSDQRLSGLPIIALTARAMPEEQEKCMAAGANDYLTKPVDIERLLTLLRVVLFKRDLAA